MDFQATKIKDFEYGHPRHFEKRQITLGIHPSNLCNNSKSAENFSMKAQTGRFPKSKPVITN